jgi:RimJ/RimL family protein N-acetyltransferase
MRLAALDRGILNWARRDVAVDTFVTGVYYVASVYFLAPEDTMASFTTIDDRDLSARLAQPRPGGPWVEPHKPRRGEPLRLADDTDVEIRPLERSDREALASAVARLSERSRYLRFASPKPRLSERELDTLTELDRHSSDALLATDATTCDIVGIARFAAEPDKEGVVDIAVTVGDPWQGRGLGTALLARLIERARDEGHLVLQATVLAENTASIAMLRRAGFASRSGAGAMREFELAFSEPRGREDP